ncbi:MAG: 4Fe-4S binding protein [Rhodospirillales bacterium]|nr:4Fe-4S binding protein [Rhodospirillales bacterium]
MTAVVAIAAGSQAAAAELGGYLEKASPTELVPGADRLGQVKADPPVAPAYRGDELVGYVFLNSDIANAVGYSGRPIHILIGLTIDGKISGAKLVAHHEPIVLVGIPESKILGFLRGLVGYDAVSMTAPAEGGGPDIISGATVTVLVIQDSVTRAAAQMVRRLGLGGASAFHVQEGPQRSIDTDQTGIEDWQTLLGEGSVRRLHLTVGDINQAFEKSGNAEAAARPLSGAADDPFIDLYVAQVSVPTIGRSLLGEAEYDNLMQRLKEGQQAILVAGVGTYSFKGSGYVRGGIFDRFQVNQDTITVRFRDRDHHRLRAFAAAGAPDLPEIGVFAVPTETGFQAALPWRLGLLVQRATGALSKAFFTFEVGYAIPERYLTPLPAPQPTPASSPAVTAASQDGGRTALWKSIWANNLPSIAATVFGILTLTAIFFFQSQLVKRPKLLDVVRLSFLTYTLVWLGWWMNAQLSVVNVLAFSNALASDFSWEYFLMDPLVFILWFATAAALLFWGRGPFCGWLCPFGALQELTNRIARTLGVKQWRVPWGLHERLWPIKYMIFLALFGLSLYDLALAERLSEVEPFKTAIVLKFVRDWPFVVYAGLLLAIGLFIERFFCRYLCPLGAALAIPGRIRMFEWLKRWPECGSQCQRCAHECPVQSIHPEGHINPNECIYCLHCQELYFDDHRCPHNITVRLKRERRSALSRRPRDGETPAEGAAAKAVTSRQG